MSGEPEQVPAEALHAGDDVVITKDGKEVTARILRSLHGTDTISNIVILTCEPDGGAPQFTVPFQSDVLIARVHANNSLAAA